MRERDREREREDLQPLLLSLLSSCHVLVTPQHDTWNTLPTTRLGGMHGSGRINIRRLLHVYVCARARACVCEREGCVHSIP